MKDDMTSKELIKANLLLEHSIRLLEQDGGGDVMPGNKEGGTGNAGQEKEAGTAGDPSAVDDLGDEVGDEAAAKSDTAGDPIDYGTKVTQAVTGGVDQAREVIKGVVGEAIKSGISEAFKKQRKSLVSDYNKMSFKEMPDFHGKLSDVADKVIEGLDLKSMVYEGIGEMLKSK